MPSPNGPLTNVKNIKLAQNMMSSMRTDLDKVVKAIHRRNNGLNRIEKSKLVDKLRANWAGWLLGAIRNNNKGTNMGGFRFKAGQWLSNWRTNHGVHW